MDKPAVTPTCVIIEELDVPVLLGGDGDRQRGMTQHFVDLTGSFCEDMRGSTLAWKPYVHQLRLHHTH